MNEGWIIGFRTTMRMPDVLCVYIDKNVSTEMLVDIQADREVRTYRLVRVGDIFRGKEITVAHIEQAYDEVAALLSRGVILISLKEILGKILEV
jgi:hypothetical protein